MSLACRKCGAMQLIVYDSRGDGNTIMRRRVCTGCGAKYRTQETIIEEVRGFTWREETKKIHRNKRADQTPPPHG